MTELCSINPFAEAMYYYFGKANGESFRKRLAETLKQYPEHKTQLEKMLNPIVELEKMLNSQLDADDELVFKYFGKFAGRIGNQQAFGCLAFVMIFDIVMRHYDLTTEELCKYLQECTAEERLYSFSVSLVRSTEFVATSESRTETFVRHVEDAQIALKDKLLIMEAAFTYEKHIAELLSVLMPAVKLIEAAQKEYGAAIEIFSKQYSGDSIETFLSSLLYTLKLPSIESARIIPMLFCFDDKIGIVESFVHDALPEGSNGDYSSCEITYFLGIAVPRISKTPQTETAALCEKLKTLSDNTRLDILFYLCSHRAYGQELCNQFNIQRSTVSYHISKLLDAGFVNAEISGVKTYYTADKVGIQKMIDVFAEKIK